MRDAFGKVNRMHTHVLPWTDRPLVTQNLLGGEDGISDAGISLARLIPNPCCSWRRPARSIAASRASFHRAERGDLAYVGHLRAYRDLTESTNLDLGGSFACGHNDGVGADDVHHAALRRRRHLPLAAAAPRHLPRVPRAHRARLEPAREHAGRRATPSASTSPASTSSPAAGSRARRYDHSERADDPSLRDKGGSLLLTYWPSEFSQVRGQYRAHDATARAQTANEFLFQFLFSIGAHGAHAF